LTQPPSPKISVIICTHDRCFKLRDTLTSLAQMSAPQGRPWELIVVDNNSSDATKDVIQIFASGSPLNAKYVFEDAPGLSHARNRGVAESTGEIISFLDDDVVVDANWLTEIAKAFDQYEAACVGGRVLLWGNPRVPSWWHRDFDFVVGKFDRGDKVILEEKNPYRVGIGANISFRRSVFDKYGLFHTGMGRVGNQLKTGEETELVLRLQRGKELAIYYPSAVVYHNFPSERFSRKYLRRSSYYGGEWDYLCGWTASVPCPKLFDVPRWMYRSALESAAKMVSLQLLGRRTEAFIHERSILIFFGYFMAAQRMRRLPGERLVGRTVAE
jgi:glucosyl-dolichyl phosphate glucuronosyltransferase